MKKSWNFIDLTGQRFGRLVVVERVTDHITPSGATFVQWKCVCDCGNNTVVSTLSLRRSSGTRSCGCLQKETATRMCTKHGHSSERVYGIWNHIKQRCSNPNNDSFDFYGAEGKDVCAEWANSFQAFYDWAIANGYSDKLTIDRIDNSKGYYPENCRWATRKEQANNTRRTRFVTYGGKKMSLTQLSEITGVKKKILYDRIVTRNWDVERAVSTRKGKYEKHNTI